MRIQMLVELEVAADDSLTDCEIKYACEHAMRSAAKRMGLTPPPQFEDKMEIKLKSLFCPDGAPVKQSGADETQ